MKRCIKFTRSVRATRSVIVFKTASKEPGRRKGGKGDLYDGWKREDIKKDKLSLFVIAYHPLKETNPNNVHLTFSEA